MKRTAYVLAGLIAGLAGCRSDATTEVGVLDVEVRVLADSVPALVRTWNTDAGGMTTVAIETEVEILNRSPWRLQVGTCPMLELRTEAGVRPVATACPAIATAPSYIEPGAALRTTGLVSGCLSGNCGPDWELTGIDGRYRFHLPYAPDGPLGGRRGAWTVAVSAPFTVFESR